MDRRYAAQLSEMKEVLKKTEQGKRDVAREWQRERSEMIALRKKLAEVEFRKAEPLGSENRLRALNAELLDEGQKIRERVHEELGRWLEDAEKRCAQVGGVNSAEDRGGAGEEAKVTSTVEGVDEGDAETGEKRQVEEEQEAQGVGVSGGSAAKRAKQAGTASTSS